MNDEPNTPTLLPGSSGRAHHGAARLTMDVETRAKLRQGYREDLEPAICAYCDLFTGHPPEKPHMWLSAARRVHQRCLLGGFHAKPGATCQEWRPRTKAKIPSCPPSPVPGPESPPRRAA